MNARECAVLYLNRRLHTKSQVIKHLKDRGYSDPDVNEVIRELEEYHYIDDRRFTELYFQMSFDKGKGMTRIKKELAERGIEADLME